VPTLRFCLWKPWWAVPTLRFLPAHFATPHLKFISSSIDATQTQRYHRNIMPHYFKCCRYVAFCTLVVFLVGSVLSGEAIAASTTATTPSDSAAIPANVNPKRITPIVRVYRKTHQAVVNISSTSI